MNYDIRYKPGKEMANVDTLSRDINDEVVLAMMEDIREDIATKGTIEIDIPTEEKRIVIPKGKEIWSTTEDGRLWTQPTWWSTPRLVLETLQDKRETLEAIHGNGHFGYKKCYYALQRRFYWKGMRMDCKIYCTSCPVCQCRAAPLKQQGGNLGKIVATRRNELVGIDLYSGIPTSIRGFKHIMVTTDYVTKYCIAVPVTGKTANVIALALYEYWIVIFGFPEKIQSDQGKEFVGKVAKSLYEILQIKKVQTSGYHPQANGQVERFNRTMSDMLAKLCAHDQTNWCYHVRTIAMEYNAYTHRVTGETPHYLMFGRDFIFPIDIAKRLPAMKHKDWRNSQLPELMKRLDASIKRIETSHKQNAKHYNAKRKPHRFQVGDMVMEWAMLRTNKEKKIHKKISLPGFGPYKILSVSDDGNTVKLIDIESPKGTVWVTNVSRIRPYIVRPEWMINPDNKPVTELTGPINTEDTEKLEEEFFSLSDLKGSKIKKPEERKRTLDSKPSSNALEKAFADPVYKHPLCITKAEALKGLK